MLLKWARRLFTPRVPSEVGFVSPGEEFGHVPEIAQPIVDRRSREHEERLRAHGAVQQVVEPVVARPVVVILIISLPSRIAEVMRLVDQDNVSKLCDAAKPLRENRPSG